MVNRKTPITFSPCELNALLEDPHSCVLLKKGKRHLALHPSTLGDIKKAIKENLNSTVTQFDAELDGILLGVTNVKVLSNEGTIVNDSCHVHLDIKARFYIFKPQVGCQLTGVVKKLSTDNIGCLVHNVFNVAIPRQEEGSTEDEIDNIELGNQVTFTVEYLDFSGTLPYIRGKLIPVRGVPHGKKRKNKEGTIQNKKRKTDVEEDTENDDKSGLFHELESSRAALFSVKQTSKPTGVCDEIKGQSDPTTEIGETYSKREKELPLNEQPENLSSKKKKKDKKREKGTLGTIPRDLKEIISEVEERIKREAVDDSSMNLKEIHGKEYESKQLPAVEMKSKRKNKNTAESFVQDMQGSDSEVKVPLVKKVIKKEMSESPSEQNLPVSYEHTKKKKKRIGVGDENSRETETMAEEPLGKKKRKRSINAQEEGDASAETPSCEKNARSHVEVNDLSCNVSKLSDEDISPKKKKKEKHWNKTQGANFGMKVKKESAVREHSDLKGIALNDLDAYVSKKKKKKKIKFEALNISEETNTDSSTPSEIKVGDSKESEKQEGASSSIEFGADANNFSNDEVKQQKTSRSDTKEQSIQDLPADIIKKQAILSSSGPKQVAVESELESNTSSKHGYNKRKKKHEEMLPQVNTVRLNQLEEYSDQTTNSSDTKIKKCKLKKEPKASPKPTDLSVKGVTQKSTLRFPQSADQNQIYSTFEQLSPIKKSGILDASNEEEDDDYSFATSTQIVTSSPYNTSNTKTCSNNKDLDLRRLLHSKKDFKAVISDSDVSYHCEASGKGSTKMPNRMNITPDCCTPKHSLLQSKPKEKISLPHSDSDSDIGENISLPTFQQQTDHNFSEQRISKKSKQKQDSDSLSGSHSSLQIDKKSISKKVKIKEKKSGTKSTQHTAIPSNPSVQKHVDGPIERNDEFSFLNQVIKSKSKRKDLSKHSAAKLSESDMGTAPQQETKQMYFMQQHTSEHELSGVKDQDEVVGKTSERRKKKDVLSLENQELISYKDAGSSNRGPAKKQELGLVSSKYFGFGTPPVVSKSPQTRLSASPKHEGNCLKNVSSPKKKTSDQVTSAATSAHTVDSESDSDSSSSKVTKMAKKISPFRANVTQMETNQFSPIFSKTQSQSEDSDDSDDVSAREDLARNVTNKQCGVPVHKKASPVKQKYLPVSAKLIIGGSESDHSLPKGSKYKDKLSSSPKKNRVPVVSSQIQKQGAYINTSDSDDDFYLPLTQKSPDKGRIINTLQGDMSSGAKINTNGPTMKQSSRKQKEMRAIPAPKSEETNSHASVFKKSNSKQQSPKQQLSIQQNASKLSSTATRKNEMEEHPAQDSDSASMQSDGASSNNPLQKNVSPNKRSPVRKTTRELPKATKINKSSIPVKSVSGSESSENSVKLNIDPRSLTFDELLKSRQLAGNLPASFLRLLPKQQTGK